MKRRTGNHALGLLVQLLLLVFLIALPTQGCKGAPPEEKPSGKLADKPVEKPADKPADERALSMATYWKTLFKDDPESEAEYERIQAEFRKGRHAVSITGLQELLKRSPQAPWAEAVEFYLAQVWMVLRQYRNALDAFDVFLDRYPNSPAIPGALMSKGQIYLVNGKALGSSDTEEALRKEYLQKAEELFQRIVKEYPEDGSARVQAAYSLGEVFLAGQDNNRAREVFQEVADTYGDTAYAGKALYALAGIRLGEGDVEGAGRVFGEIAERYPSSPLAEKAAKKLKGIRLVGSQARPIQVTEWVGEPPAGGDGYEGKVTLLSFWAIWCPHCKRNIPKMEQILKTYGNRGVSVVGITREREGQGADKVREFVQNHSMSYPTALDDGGRFSEEMCVDSIPCVIAVDGKGRIFWHGHPDYLTDRVIEGLLQESS